MRCKAMRSSAISPVASCGLQSLRGLPVLALGVLLLAPASASGADTFPRGPGLYFHPLKLIALFVVYLCWIRTCWWVDQDTKALRLGREGWNALLLGCALGGVIVRGVLSACR